MLHKVCREKRENFKQLCSKMSCILYTVFVYIVIVQNKWSGEQIWIWQRLSQHEEHFRKLSSPENCHWNGGRVTLQPTAALPASLTGACCQYGHSIETAACCLFILCCFTVHSLATRHGRLRRSLKCTIDRRWNSASSQNALSVFALGGKHALWISRFKKALAIRDEKCVKQGHYLQNQCAGITEYCWMNIQPIQMKELSQGTKVICWQGPEIPKWNKVGNCSWVLDCVLKTWY